MCSPRASRTRGGGLCVAALLFSPLFVESFVHAALPSAISVPHLRGGAASMKGASLDMTKLEMEQDFKPLEDATVKDWTGVYIDLFSPDDKNPASRRFVDLDAASGELQVSADTGGEQWGRRFDPNTEVNPILATTGYSPAARTTSFISKVPLDAPVRAEAEAGALNFTLTLGMACGKKVIKWNGLYNGQGGPFGGNVVPPTDCDNFWELVV